LPSDFSFELALTLEALREVGLELLGVRDLSLVAPQVILPHHTVNVHRLLEQMTDIVHILLAKLIRVLVAL